MTGVEMEQSAVPRVEPSLADELRSSALLLGFVLGTTSVVAVGGKLLVRVLS